MGSLQCRPRSVRPTAQPIGPYLRFSTSTASPTVTHDPPSYRSIDKHMHRTTLATTNRPTGKLLEVFLVFLRLGLTSFGGPVAHLSYFRDAFVERRKWLSEKAYADIVALCQMLP